VALDTALLGAEYEADRFHWTGALTQAVADAAGGSDRGSLSVADGDHIFRTDRDTVCGAMQRSGSMTGCRLTGSCRP
jgi:hypothetical protein